MLKVLLDTNQLAGSVLSARGIQGRIVDEWRRQAFLLFVAPGQVDEIAEVLSRPKLAKKYPLLSTDREALLALLHAEAVLLPDARPPRVCRDPDDDHLLGCAAARRVDYIVTGDSALLAVGQFDGVTIVDGRQFLSVLSRLAD